MERNKTIKIFIASSDELVNDRNAFGNLVRRLDKIYEQKGIRIELFEWEDYDAAYNDRRKQDEYNDQVRACDMFLALFHIKAGKYTIEEFDVATEEFRCTGKTPKSYVYCRKIEEGEQESDELKDFKKRLFEEMGHYWSNYDNQDSMQLHFVMQLQLVENSGMVEKLKLEDGKILLEGMPIARMNNLRFASNNKDYLKISAELVELPTRIERARQRVEKLPNDKDLLDDLQQKIDYYNSLKKEFNHLQNALFETALRIASIQFEHVSELLRQAIGAFENGNIERANAFLDVIAHEAEQHFAQLDQQRTLVHEDIEAFQLQTKTILANVSLPIDERIERVAAIYAKADNWAEKSALDKEKHAILLSEYFRFLSEFALYDKEEAICHRLLNLCKVVYGDGHPYTAVSYGNLGSVYDDKGDYNKALEYYFKGLSILEKKLGVERVETSVSYSNIGYVYGNMGEYQSALDYYFKALEIQEKLQDDEYLLVATSCGGIGSVYDRLGNYTKALDYYFKALTIIQKRCKEDCSDISILYGNIGGIYDNLGNYSEALEYLFKALAIQNKLLGYYHPLVAISYMKIGMVYYDQADYSNALDYYYKALEVQKRVYGDDHPDISDSYNCIGAVYLDLNDYSKALEFFYKSLSIREKVLGLEHVNTAVSYNNIGAVYKSQGEYDKALEFYSKSLDIKLKVFGHDSIATATSFHNVGGIYSNIGDFDKALEYYRKALDISVSILGAEHPDIADSYNDIGTILQQQGNCSEALEFMLKTLSIYKTVYGIEHPKTALSLFNIGYVYYSIKNYTKAIEYYYKSLAIRELILGIDHHDTATSYYNIGLAYFKQGDYLKAMDHFIKAKTIFEKYLDNSHPNIIALQDNIAFVKGLMDLLSSNGIRASKESVYFLESCLSEYERELQDLIDRRRCVEIELDRNQKERETNEVYSSIFAPAEVKRKSHLQVQMYLHLYEETEKVKFLAQESDKDAERRDYIPLQCKLKKGDKVDVQLNIYGETLLMSDRKRVVWQGSFTKCSFDYFVPKDIDVDELSCVAMLTVNGVPVGEMRFISRIVDTPRRLNPEIIAHKYNKVFISYSHQDESKVKFLHEGLELGSVPHFFDRKYLKAGDVFPQVIQDYINSADLFILCWSENASKSEYVQKERLQALERAFPQVKPEQEAKLRIYPMSIEPRAELPTDMKENYHFGEM